jgi:DNA-directed RNA polymerase specialized sigma subunit
MEKIKSFLSNDKKWEVGIHKEIAEKLNISNIKVSKYITAMLKLGKITKLQH